MAHSALLAAKPETLSSVRTRVVERREQTPLSLSYTPVLGIPHIQELINTQNVIDM